ncbi:MAG: hypothetical protein V4556_03090 [Bacteroidota bacterium]
MNKKIIGTIFYFIIATLITWTFIQSSPLYATMQQKFLSMSVAGAKWGIQIIAAFVLLKEARWQFLNNIAFTSLVGSVILLPYAALSGNFSGDDNQNFFIGSLLLAVAVMIIMYALSVKKAGVSIYWWLGWLACLAIAITLQLTVVFHVL